MPVRFLKPGITASDRWNDCSWQAQSFYIRIITIVDDAGRCEADVRLLRSRCFPTRDDVTRLDTSNMLVELENHSLVRVYEVDGKQYLQVTRWTERVRARGSMWPAPIEQTDVQHSAAHEDEQPHGGAEFESAACAAHEASPCAAPPVPSPTSLKTGKGQKDDEPESEQVNGLPQEAQLWNLYQKLPKVIRMTSKRKRALTARRKDPFWREHVAEALQKIVSSDFCMGNNDRSWVATFDWFIRPDTLQRIIEGTYDNKHKNSRRVGQPRFAKPATTNDDRRRTYSAAARNRRT